MLVGSQALEVAIQDDVLDRTLVLLLAEGLVRLVGSFDLSSGGKSNFCRRRR